MTDTVQFQSPACSYWSGYVEVSFESINQPYYTFQRKLGFVQHTEDASMLQNQIVHWQPFKCIQGPLHMESSSCNKKVITLLWTYQAVI